MYKCNTIKIRTLFLLILCVFIHAYSRNSSGPEAKAVFEKENFLKSRFWIDLNQENSCYPFMIPVKIKIHLKNNSNHDVVIPYFKGLPIDPGLQTSMIAFYYKMENWDEYISIQSVLPDFRPYKEKEMSINYSQKLQTLQPDQEELAEIDMICDWRLSIPWRSLFEKPDRYFIRAELFGVVTKNVQVGTGLTAINFEDFSLKLSSDEMVICIDVQKNTKTPASIPAPAKPDTSAKPQGLNAQQPQDVPELLAYNNQGPADDGQDPLHPIDRTARDTVMPQAKDTAKVGVEQKPLLGDFSSYSVSLDSVQYEDPPRIDGERILREYRQGYIAKLLGEKYRKASKEVILATLYKLSAKPKKITNKDLAELNRDRTEKASMREAQGVENSQYILYIEELVRCLCRNGDVEGLKRLFFRDYPVLEVFNVTWVSGESCIFYYGGGAGRIRGEFFVIPLDAIRSEIGHLLILATTKHDQDGHVVRGQPNELRRGVMILLNALEAPGSADSLDKRGVRKGALTALYGQHSVSARESKLIRKALAKSIKADPDRAVRKLARQYLDRINGEQTPGLDLKVPKSPAKPDSTQPHGLN